MNSLAVLGAKRIAASIKATEDWRRSAEAVASAVAGELVAVDPDSSSSLMQQTAPGLSTCVYTPNATGRYISDPVALKGVINRLEQTASIVLQYIAFKAPEAAVTGAESSEIAAVIEAYLKDCIEDDSENADGVDNVNSACRDFLTVGIAAVLVSPDGTGKPSLTRVSPLFDLVWDHEALEPRFSKWVAYREVIPWPELRDYLSPVGFKIDGVMPKELAALKASVEGSGGSDTDYWDRKIETLRYYDEFGNHGIFIPSKEHSGGSEVSGFTCLLYTTSEMIHTDAHGNLSPFLPVRITNDDVWEFNAGPTSPAMKAAPFQAALSRIDRMWVDLMEKNRGGWFIDASSYDHKEVKDFVEGKRKYIIADSPDVRPPAWIPGAPPEQIDLQVRSTLEEAMTRATGASPYMSGGKVEGVKFAAEVHQIQSNAGMSTSGLSSRWAMLWKRIFRSVMDVGREHDKRQLKFRISEGQHMIFGLPDEKEPLYVGSILDPAVEISVSEESMRFRSRDERLAFRGGLLDRAMSLASMFPASVGLAYREFLEEAGIKDVTAHLEPPPPIDPAMIQAEAGGEPPQAEQ